MHAGLHGLAEDVSYAGADVLEYGRIFPVDRPLGEQGDGIAAGQAIENMNLMLGLDQSAGLDLPAVFP